MAQMNSQTYNQRLVIINFVMIACQINSSPKIIFKLYIVIFFVLFNVTILESFSRMFNNIGNMIIHIKDRNEGDVRTSTADNTP